MPDYHIGSLIKRLRKQKKISQEELAYSIMDRATLSKIESGKVMPNKKNIEALFERLGYNPNNIADFLLDDESAAIKKITDELEGSLINVGALGEADSLLKRAIDLLEKLENNANFMSSVLNKQYFMTYKAILDYYTKKADAKSTMAMLIDAIKISIPEYCDRYIEDYHITRQDLRILNVIALIHYDEGRLDDSISVMRGLKNNMDNHCIDENTLGQNYPTIVYNLAICLTEAEKYEEAIKMCDHGADSCKKTGYLFMMPLLVWQKTLCLFKLGAREECERLARQVFYTADMFGQYGHREDTRRFAKEELGIDL